MTVPHWKSQSYIPKRCTFKKSSSGLVPQSGTKNCICSWTTGIKCVFSMTRVALLNYFQCWHKELVASFKCHSFSRESHLQFATLLGEHKWSTGLLSASTGNFFGSVLRSLLGDRYLFCVVCLPVMALSESNQLKKYKLYLIIWINLVNEDIIVCSKLHFSCQRMSKESGKHIISLLAMIWCVRRMTVRLFG